MTSPTEEIVEEHTEMMKELEEIRLRLEAVEEDSKLIKEDQLDLINAAKLVKRVENGQRRLIRRLSE